VTIVEEKKGDIILNVLIQPKASKAEIVGPQGESLKIRLTSPPVEGAANEECRSLLSKVLKIPKKKIDIIRGLKSRTKKLRLSGISRVELEKILKL
jgi:uncharacterized protein (TIGR00251 family)